MKSVVVVVVVGFNAIFQHMIGFTWQPRHLASVKFKIAKATLKILIVHKTKNVIDLITCKIGDDSVCLRN
jgi:hypothetical protein